MDVSIDSIRAVDTPTGMVPVVLLEPADEPSEDVLAIYVGIDEARSIVRGLDAVDLPRPFTHDLFLDVIQELGGHVARVVVSDLDEGTYYADLELDTPRAEASVDARPSDAIALAARTGAELAVTDDLFESERQNRSDFEGLDDIRELMGHE
jgi:bifunctional DNase/RNase